MSNTHKLTSMNFSEVHVIGEMSNLVLTNKVLLRDKDVSDRHLCGTSEYTLFFCLQKKTLIWEM